MDLFLCKVDSKYLCYLHGIDNKVSIKYDSRPYVGVVTMINGMSYVLPLTSQTTHMRELEGKKKRNAKTTTFIRDSSGKEIANILHNNMIPVDENYIERLTINAEEDTYESNEIRYIRKHSESIISKAKKVHDARICGNDHFLSRICCDFAALENAFRQFL